LRSLSKHCPREVSKEFGRKRLESFGLHKKDFRKVAEHLMRKVLGKGLTAFILGRIGELGVSERHYVNLLREADEVYWKYLDCLKWTKNNNAKTLAA